MITENELLHLHGTKGVLSASDSMARMCKVLDNRSFKGSTNGKRHFFSVIIIVHHFSKHGGFIFYRKIGGHMFSKRDKIIRDWKKIFQNIKKVSYDNASNSLQDEHDVQATIGSYKLCNFVMINIGR